MEKRTISTHGGKRKGAGRKPKENETHMAYVGLDARLIDGIQSIGVKNRTAYINYLIAADLMDREKKNKKLYSHIVTDLSDKFLA